jgi:hypothetical protein
MKEYIPIIVSIIAGLFAIGSAIFTWKLKQSSEKSLRTLTEKDKHHNELKTLYIKVHEMFEEAIKAIQEYKNNDLNSRFSTLTAEIQMIASEEVIEKYNQVATLCDDWATLYHKAYPAPKNGYNIIYSKISDPTLQYKEPAKNSYNKFYTEYEHLIKLMRSELANET